MYIKESKILGKKIEFTKMHGAGNDFIIIRDYKLKEAKINLNKEFINKICDRNFGVGSDGLLIISATDKKIIYKMYNPDGMRVEMCGNGIICFMKYLHEKKIIDKEFIDIETDNGILSLNYKNNIVTVDMGKPKKIKDLTYNCKDLGDIFLIKAKDKTFKFTPISMGNPHAVIYLLDHDIDEYNIHKYGSIIENTTDIFQSKTNVEFVNIISNTELKTRVWERGTGETLACGTGACAIIVSGILFGYLLKDKFIKLNFKGGILYAKWSGNIKDSVILKGEAQIVFEGSYHMSQNIKNK